MRYELVHPQALALLAIPVLLAAWTWWRRRTGRPALRLPSLALLASAPRGLKARTRAVPVLLRLLALAAVAVALARPRGGESRETVTTEGIDIVISLDTSGSMLTEDMAVRGARANRLDAAKDVITEFIRRRPADRIGLVTFDEASVPRCPPTSDHGVLVDLVSEVRLDDEGGRTAIGSGLSSAVNRLKDSQAKSRVVILVTDGRNNAGRIGPRDAAELARLLGIKVYTIGVGSRGLADYPVRTSFGVTRYEKVASDIDEVTLAAVAEATNGLYFRASNRGELDRIFEQLDGLEKTKVEVERHVRYHELFPPFVQAAAVLAALGLLGGATLWRSFP